MWLSILNVIAVLTLIAIGAPYFGIITRKACGPTQLDRTVELLTGLLLINGIVILYYCYLSSTTGVPFSFTGALPYTPPIPLASLPVACCFLSLGYLIGYNIQLFNVDGDEIFARLITILFWIGVVAIYSFLHSIYPRVAEALIMAGLIFALGTSILGNNRQPISNHFA